MLLPAPRRDKGHAVAVCPVLFFLLYLRRGPRGFWESAWGNSSGQPQCRGRPPITVRMRNDEAGQAECGADEVHDGVMLVETMLK